MNAWRKQIENVIEFFFALKNNTPTRFGKVLENSKKYLIYSHYKHSRCEVINCFLSTSGYLQNVFSTHFIIISATRRNKFFSVDNTLIHSILL